MSTSSVTPMTSWLVEGYAPFSTDLAEVQERAREAASVESVREVARRALLSAQRIVEAEP